MEALNRDWNPQIRRNTDMADIAVRKTESLWNDMEKIHERILHRAYEIFVENGEIWGRDLENWLAAEREIVWKPAIELKEKDRQFELTVAVAGVEPKDLEIEVTPEDLVIKGETHHDDYEERAEIHVCEFEGGKLFRAIHFPRKINPDKVRAQFKNGLLTLTAPVAEEARAKKVAVVAA
jgi:HSP20 family protein